MGAGAGKKRPGAGGKAEEERVQYLRLRGMILDDGCFRKLLRSMKTNQQRMTMKKIRQFFEFRRSLETPEQTRKTGRSGFQQYHQQS